MIDRAAKETPIQNNLHVEAVVTHNFLNTMEDDGSEHLWHGYPDECWAFTSFVDSLVAQVLYRGWGVQPPITVVRKALVVDFASERQSEAEVSLGHGWNGTWEFPMGVTNTVHSRVEVNEQNARIGRHLSVIGSAMTHEDFFRAVGEKLLDVHSCQDRTCKICEARATRGLSDVFQILASGTKEAEVHLFARWEPNKALTGPLRADGISVVAHALAEIPSEDLRANRYYHILDGTEQQGHEFREAIWAPRWKKRADMRAKRSRKNLVYGNLSWGLVFLPLERVEELVRTYDALSATTWGEFHRRLPASVWTGVRKSLEEGEGVPDDEAAFTANDVPGYGDGDWPGFPAQEMLEDGFLPRDIVELGKVVTTTLNGDYLELPSSLESRILELLEVRGYVAKRDDALMSRAAGLG